MAKSTKWIIVVLVIVVVAVIVWVSRGGGVSYTEPDNTPRPVAGNADASILVEEFSDFQCPACGQANPIVDDLLAKYGNDIRFEYYHFPLVSIHANAFNAAMASECANDQGKFWEMHDIMFDHQEALSRTDLETYASQIGLDFDKYSACMKSRAKADVVNVDIDEGNSRDITGTPTFFVNGEQLDNWGILEDTVATLILQEPANTNTAE